MIDTEKYQAYFESNPTDENFKRILRARIDDNDLLPSEKERLEFWLPEEEGDNEIQVYLEDDVLKQRVKIPWNEPMAKAIEKLTMVPDPEDEFSLINTNKDAVKNIPFNVEDGDWRIIEWRIRVTESIDQPFTQTNAFPVPGAKNLLCDEIVFESVPFGKTAIMRYGWDAYEV